MAMLHQKVVASHCLISQCNQHYWCGLECSDFGSLHLNKKWAMTAFDAVWESYSDFL